MTYSSSVINNILDIAGGIDHARIVGSLTGELRVTGDFKRKALAVADMPVELAHLQHSLRCDLKSDFMRTYLDHAHGIERAHDVRHRKAKSYLE